MNTQENKRLVQEGYQLFQHGDIAGMLARCHDDVEWISAESDYVPVSGNFRGKQALAELFYKLDASMQAIRYEPQDFIAENDKVVAMGQASWEVKLNGRRFDSPWVHVYTLRDGKIARIQAYTDTAASERAFRPEQPASASMGTELRH